MKNLLLILVIHWMFLGRGGADANLNNWLLQQIHKDEQLLQDSYSEVDGHSIQLLEDSRNYVPFFLEVPVALRSQAPKFKQLFDDVEDDDLKIVPGGYIYRLNFPNWPPLYSTSGGNVDGITWYHPQLGKNLEVEPTQVWVGNNTDYSFATLLAGFSPKLLVYDKNGSIIKQEIYDLSDEDAEQRISNAERTYSVRGVPILEHITLAEYLENPDIEWRKTDLSGDYNLTNQYQRQSERDHLESRIRLTRDAAVKGLNSKLSQSRIEKQLSEEPTAQELLTPKSVSAPPMGSISASSYSKLPLIGVSIMLLAIASFLGWLFLKKNV